MNPSLFPLWMATGEREPSAVAVGDGATGRRWTREALAVSAAKWAEGFGRAAGSSTDVRCLVAISVPNGIEWLKAFLGLQAAGAVPAPIDPTESEEAQHSVAAAIGARFIWREGRLMGIGSGSTGRPPRDVCLVKLSSGS